MNARVFAAINDQINSEFQASYTYLAMSGFCDRQKFLVAFVQFFTFRVSPYTIWRRLVYAPSVSQQAPAVGRDKTPPVVGASRSRRFHIRGIPHAAETRS